LEAVNKKTSEADLDIEEKILRRREMSHLFQWYYPEGGWGWIILVCAMLSQMLAHGIQFGFSYPLGVAIRKRFHLSSIQNDNGLNHEQSAANQDTIDDHDQYDEDLERRPILAQHIGK
jgi:hypothetical protein